MAVEVTDAGRQLIVKSAAGGSPFIVTDDVAVLPSLSTTVTVTEPSEIVLPVKLVLLVFIKGLVLPLIWRSPVLLE